MSLARKSNTSSFLLQRLRSSSDKSNHRANTPGVSTQLKLILLAGLAFLHKAQAAYTDRVYALEPSTNTNYQIDYNSAELPEMKTRLMDFCNMILFGTAQTIYSHAATPQCESDTGALGPMVDVAVETGKDITQSFMSCFSDGMQGMCDEYFDNNYSSSSSTNPMVALIIVGSILAVLASVIAICACYNSRCCRRSHNYDSSYKSVSSVSDSVSIVPAASSSGYSTFSSNNSSGYYSGNTSSSPVIYTPPPPPPVIYTPPPVVVIPIPEPAPVHHHDHHDHGHHSSVTWHR